MFFLLHCFTNAILFINILPHVHRNLHPLLLQRTSILRKCNSHTLTVIQEKHCCYATLHCSKTSQRQSLSSSSLRDRNGSLSYMEQVHRKLQQGPDNYRVYAQGSSRAKRVFFFLYPQMCTCGYLGNP